MKALPLSKNKARKSVFAMRQRRRLGFSLLKCLGLGLGAAALFSSFKDARADTTWIGGTSQDWNNPANWSNGLPTAANNNGAAIINTATGNFPIYTATTGTTQTAYDIFVGTGTGSSGRLDQTGGSLSSGNGNWTFIGANGATAGTYNLADTTTAGGTLTSFGTGTGSFTTGRLNVGGGQFNGTGTGTVNINTTGTVTLNNGTNGTGNPAISLDVGVGAGSTGTVNFDNGTISATNQSWIGDGGTGRLNISGGVFNPGAALITGINGGTGTLTMTGGFINGTGDVRFGDAGTASNGTLNLSGTGTIIAGGNAIFGRAGGTGTLNMTGGELDSVNETWFGEAGSATQTATGMGTIGTGGTLNVSTWLVVGRSGATGSSGTLTLNGGTANVRVGGVNGNLEVAVFDASSGTLNINANSNINLQSNANIILGSQNTTGNGTVNQAGGNVTFYSDAGSTTGGTGALTLGGGSSKGVYTYNLNGGNLIVPSINKTTTSTGQGVFNFNGGTLTPTASTATFMQGLTTANVRNGGAKINTNGFNVTIAQPLLHSTVTGDNTTDGGLTKTGTGTLTLGGANTFNGPNVVSAGTLAYTGIQTGTGSISVANNAGLSVRSVAPGTTMVAPSSLTLGTTGPTTLTFDFNNLNTTAPLISTGTLTANGTVNVSLLNGTLLTTGAHTLIGYTSFTGGGTFAGSPFALGARSAGTLTNNGTSALVLNVTADSPVWTGLDNGNWKVGTTGTNRNWKLISAGTATDYIEGDAVLFDDTATGSTAVNISTANVSPAITTFNNATKNYTVGSTGGFGIAGTGGLTKTGAGGLVITTANTYTGATTIGAGATLTLGDGTTGHDGTITGTSGVTDNGTLDFNRFGTTNTAAYVISGSGGVAKDGVGTQVLSGVNTYTGGTAINAGVLSIGADANLGASASGVTLNGGTLTTTAGFTDTHAITVGAGGGTINVSSTGQLFMNTANTLLGSGALTVTGSSGTLAGQSGAAGNLRLGQANTYSGNVTARSGGIFEYGATGAVGAGATFTVGNEGEVALQGNPATTMPNAVTVTGGTNSVLSFENGNAGIYGGNIAANANLTVGLRDWYNNATVRSGTISGIVSGAGSLTVNSGTGSGGLLTLASANTYAGGTTLTASQALAGTSTSFGTGAITVGGTAAEVQLADGVNVANALTINGGGVAVQGVVYVPTANANATYSGPINITAAQTAGGHFAANGGTLTLTGPITSTVPVATRVGTIVLANAGNSFTQLTVQAGAVKLGVAGAIPAAASVDLGASGAATLDLGGFNQTLVGLTKNTNAATVTNSGATASTLTTTGTSTFAGVIQDGASTNALAVNGGALTLTGANSYTGGTTVASGMLVANRANNQFNPTTSALGNPQVAQNITVNNGATLNFAQGDTLGSADSAIVASLVINAGGTVNNVGTNFNALGNVVLNGGTLTTLGGAIAGYQSYSLNGGVTVGGAAASNISVTGAGNAFNGVHLGTNTAFAVADATGSAASDLNVSAPLIDRNSTLGGAGGFTKSGVGTMTLSAVNTYTGTTTVNGGILTIAATGSINGSATVQVTTGTLTLQNTASLSDTGLLSLANGTTLNLSAASGTETVGGLRLNGTVVGPGTYTALQLTTLDPLIIFTSATGETLTVSAVPEPSSLSLGGALLGAMAGYSQRRRIQAWLRRPRVTAA